MKCPCMEICKQGKLIHGNIKHGMHCRKEHGTYSRIFIPPPMILVRLHTHPFISPATVSSPSNTKQFQTPYLKYSASRPCCRTYVWWARAFVHFEHHRDKLQDRAWKRWLVGCSKDNRVYHSYSSAARARWWKPVTLPLSNDRMLASLLPRPTVVNHPSLHCICFPLPNSC